MNLPPHHAFPAITWEDLRAELDREIAYRREAFPRMVGKGHMTQADADRQIDLFCAIREDAERFAGAAAPGRRMVNPAGIPRRHAYTWNERRAALSRELDYRRRVYPGWIGKGRLTTADAGKQTQRLTCMRAIYELGYDWKPQNDERGHGGVLIEWQEIEADIAGRDGTAQEQLAL